MQTLTAHFSAINVAQVISGANILGETTLEACSSAVLLHYPVLLYIYLLYSIIPVLTC